MCDYKIETGMVLITKKHTGIVMDSEVLYFNEDGSGCGSNTIDSTIERGILEILKPNTPKSTNIGIDINKFLSAEYLRTYFITVWKKKEKVVEELTLEQVCKELGRDIKIVK